MMSDTVGCFWFGEGIGQRYVGHVGVISMGARHIQEPVARASVRALAEAGCPVAEAGTPLTEGETPLAEGGRLLAEVGNPLTETGTPLAEVLPHHTLSERDPDLFAGAATALVELAALMAQSREGAILIASLETRPPRGAKRPGALTARQESLIDARHTANLTGLSDLDRLITALRCARGRMLMETKAVQQWHDPKNGHKNFADWRASETGAGSREAVTEIKTAETLATVSGAQEAVDAGAITLTHIEKISNLGDQAVRGGGRALTAAERAALVEMAKRGTADAFGKNASRWLNGRDPVQHDAEHAEVRRRRYLRVYEQGNAMRLDGLLDMTAGKTLKLALEAAMSRPGLGDMRTSDQRRADALELLATTVMNEKALKAGALVRPHVTFLMTEATFASATEELRRRRALAAARAQAVIECGHGAQVSLLGVPSCDCWERNLAVQALADPVQMDPATFEDGTAIPLTELARLMCDVEMTRVVLTAEGLPMNIGQRKRSFSDEHRKAVIARDRGCAFEGCAAQARWCEIHHIEWWINGGQTSINNGVLACKFHHARIHTGMLTVVPDGHGKPILVATNHVGRDRPGAPPTRCNSEASPSSTPPSSTSPSSAPLRESGLPRSESGLKTVATAQAGVSSTADSATGRSRATGASRETAPSLVTGGASRAGASSGTEAAARNGPAAEFRGAAASELEAHTLFDDRPLSEPRIDPNDDTRPPF